MPATNPSTPRKRYARTAETRATIARAALDVVYEKGHAALTTAEVAQRAGVSETARFYHFPTRDHLLVAALELADAETADEYDTAQDAVEADLGGTLGRIARTAMGRNRAVVLLFTALGAQAPDPTHPAHNYFKAHTASSVATFARIVRERQIEGRALPDLDPVAVARQLVGVWRGLQSQWLVEPDFDLADEVRGAFRRLTGEDTMQAKRAITEVLAAI